MDNPNLILTKAAQLFSLKSFEAVGIQQIADEVKLTKPTLYYYFKSKRGILDAILKKEGTLYLDLLKRITVYRGDVKGTLESTTRGIWNYYTENTIFYSLYQSLKAMPPESESRSSVETYLVKEYNIFKELFKQISQDHGNIGERYNVYAATFMGMVFTFVDLSRRNFLYKGEELLYRMVHQYMHGIFS